jgi:putative ABC transport system permease protein
VQLIGIDAGSFAGAPPRMLEGRLEDLRLPNTVIIDELATTRLAPTHGKKLGIGDEFEINDIEARVVGICDADRSFTGGPYIWTIYERALQYSPPQRKMLSAVIAAPVAGIDPSTAAQEIHRVTGLRAYVTGSLGSQKDNFGWSTIWWYIRNTGIPVSFGITVVVGFIVGAAIACQTFYAFVLDNLRYLGALKAMGMSTLRLSVMLMVQALTVGAIGFGLGLFFTAGFARAAVQNKQPPFFMPEVIPIGAFGVIVLICFLAAMLGILRLARYEPAMVFRA